MNDEFIVPPALEPGDRVAIISPSSGAAAAYPHVYELGLERLRERFDLQPVEYPTATAEGEYLDANPEARARDVEDAFRDPEIDGVLATIGGDDQIRIVEHLDPTVLGDYPTRFFGYSDNTVLASVLWNQGVASFYGPMVMTEFAMQGSMFEHSVEYARRALFEETVGEIEPADSFSDEDLEWADPANLERERERESSDGWRWTGGAEPVTGRTWGGCLTVLDHMLAADIAVPEPERLDDAILLLETSEVLPEDWYVRQVLMSMGERGLLERIGGVVVGRAKARSRSCQRDSKARRAYRRTQRETIETEIARYAPDAPIVFDVEFGHCAPSVPVPVGAMATVDPADERIVFTGG
ncbi:S66 family peptidase [Halovivax gelatinilyticus]|uniref:S66 family peptidase n=1 Tax=Halovivax gelatinilyticus TaxID=2961597 RepID=UPI0020CA7F95|nr:S66 peptidase family protein [Halovivax gelatinilyticus]